MAAINDIEINTILENPCQKYETIFTNGNEKMV